VESLRESLESAPGAGQRIHVGTSGYVYPHWRGVLYPPGLPQARWLQRYAEFFATVELNATFYRLPSAAAVERWRDSTPAGFLFACKGSRFLTHQKRLADTGRGLERFFAPVLLLGRKLGPILWQLPPQMARADPARLDAFLAHMPRGVRCAVEFRHAAWATEEVCRVLDGRGAAFCEHDLPGGQPPGFTGEFRYLRFHGASAPASGRYGRRALARVARDLSTWPGESFSYFNNDAFGHAVRDALDLRALLARG
jgi:uncharacterized protein YecE (DUF72 family)